MKTAYPFFTDKKIGTAKIAAVKVLKMEHSQYTMHPEDKDRMAMSVGPD